MRGHALAGARVRGCPLTARRRATVPRPVGQCGVRRRRALSAVALLDYVASSADEGVLKLAPRTELDDSEIRRVFK